MSKSIWANAESGTIAIFHPDCVCFEEYFADDAFPYLTFMKEGKLLLLEMGGDGSVGIVVEVVNSLPKSEGKYLEGRIESPDGRLYFGAGECLPIEGDEFEASEDGEWFHLSLLPVQSFDSVPYHKSGSMPYLEG